MKYIIPNTEEDVMELDDNKTIKISPNSELAQKAEAASDAYDRGETISLLDAIQQLIDEED